MRGCDVARVASLVVVLADKPQLAKAVYEIYLEGCLTAWWSIGGELDGFKIPIARNKWRLDLKSCLGSALRRNLPSLS